MQFDNDLLFGNQAPPVESANNQNFFGDDGRIDDNSIVLTAVDQRKGTARGGDEIFMGGDDHTAGGGLHDETAHNLIATVGGGGISPLNSNQNRVFKAGGGTHIQ